jgi:hypothetical protein
VTGTDLDKSLEIYSPPYLFAGPRPSIVAAPATIAYASTFAVTTNPPPANGWSAALIRPSAVTHSFNMDQRYVRLAVSQSSGSQLSIAAPASANLAPPGYYMLFVVTAAGVPSIAAWVKLQ